MNAFKAVSSVSEEPPPPPPPPPPPQNQCTVSEFLSGRYVTTGSKKNKVTQFQIAKDFTLGEKVVFKVRVVDKATDSPLAGATATIAVTGPESHVLTTGATDSNGHAEAAWQTSKPNKRAMGGTLPGSYSAKITQVNANTGHEWDGNPMDPILFNLN